MPSPLEPPSALLSAYTMSHRVPLERFYVDEDSSSHGAIDERSALCGQARGREVSKKAGAKLF